ncbi:MAG: hypothetical protein HDR18_14540 [Lachnospiraceae bacterium]|nr:hypothetical protein [Lachnospiraceae bacterium]
MKNRLISLCLTLLLIGGISLPVHAETYQGGSGWRVAFTNGKRLESNFRTADLDEAVSGLQPGDNIIFTLQLQNDYSESTDWWMTNEVLHSLEDTSANSNTHGGAYTYVLTYTDKAGEAVTLFSSESVGGDVISGAGEGLHEATDAMEDYFYLDTLSTGQRGTVTLEIALDGETQGNDYQDTLADLQMNFAVEINSSGNRVRRLREMNKDFSLRKLMNGEYDFGSSIIALSNIVKTGDVAHLMLYVVLMAVSGIGILLLAIYSMKQKRKEEKEAE